MGRMSLDAGLQLGVRLSLLLQRLSEAGHLQGTQVEGGRAGQGRCRVRRIGKREKRKGRKWKGMEVKGGEVKGREGKRVRVEVQGGWDSGGIKGRAVHNRRREAKNSLNARKGRDSASSLRAHVTSISG